MGNARGGRMAAVLASLTSTCRRHDVDPQLYLTQLLTNLSQVRKRYVKPVLCGASGGSTLMQ